MLSNPFLFIRKATGMRAEGYKQANSVNQPSNTETLVRENESQEQVSPAWTGNMPKRGCFTILSINLMTFDLMSSILRYCNDSKRGGMMVKPLMQ